MRQILSMDVLIVLTLAALECQKCTESFFVTNIYIFCLPFHKEAFYLFTLG